MASEVPTDAELFERLKELQQALERRVPTTWEANAAFREADIALSEVIDLLECRRCHQAVIETGDDRGPLCAQCESELRDEELESGPDEDAAYESEVA